MYIAKSTQNMKFVHVYHKNLKLSATGKIIWHIIEWDTLPHFVIIGASLSEPHIDEKYMRDSYIYSTSVTRARRLIQNV